MNDYDVIVIGGGAAGLMCALTAGQRGRRVLVLDSSNKVGKKILMSGGGRCNFTNLDVQPENYLSANPHFCKSALARYTQWDFIAMVERHRIAYHEKTLGQLFCDDSSKAILAMLLDECAGAGVQILTRCEITAIEAAADAADTPPSGAGRAAPARFRLCSSSGDFRCASLVVASGALSIPKMGATGFGYEVARQFGHTVLPTRAGLVPFTFSGTVKERCERLSGVSVDVGLSGSGEAAGVSFAEAVLFSHRGLTGPAALQLSSYWHSGERISLNLLPGTAVGDWLREMKQARPRSRLRALLSEMLPKKLVGELQDWLWPALGDTPLAEWPGDMLTRIGGQLNALVLKPSGTEGYRTAEVTVGGVDTAGLSSRTMESRYQPGLYFVGEVVDVTGHLGGYNFQWAWASGFVAGSYA